MSASLPASGWFDIVFANLDWTEGHDRAHVEYLAGLGKEPNRIASIVEAYIESSVWKGKPQPRHIVPLADLLPKGWRVYQDTDPARGQTALAWCGDVRARGEKVRLGLAARALLTRYVRVGDFTVDGRDIRVVSAHWPLLKYGGKAGRAAYLAAVKSALKGRPPGAEWAVGPDANQPLGTVAKALGGTAHGFGIVGWVTSPGIEVDSTYRSTYGQAIHATDHPDVLCRVRIKARAASAKPKPAPVKKSGGKYAPPSPPFIAARYHGGSQTPKAVVIHGTVSSDNAGTARQIANWWHGPTSPKTSAHYIVDPRETIQCVGDHTIAYHCGYNAGSIAIELCDEETGSASRWRDADSKATVARAARTTAERCLAYGIEARRPSVAELKKHGPHGIYGHNDSRLAFGHTTHTDPRDFDWPGFLAQVNTQIKAIKAGK